MAENSRPKAKKAAKPIPPLRLYVVAPAGTAMDSVYLVRNQRDLNKVLLTNRSSEIKEFVFEREKREDDTATA